MKCLNCVTSGKKSRVTIGGSMSTLLGFQSYYDEEGQLHRHDPNYITTGYYCSEGHAWEERRRNPCPSDQCDYGKP